MKTPSGPAWSASLVLMRLRSEVRRRWGALLALAAVLALGGGASIAALAGAQRTETAVPGFVAYSEPDTGGFLYGSVQSPPVTPGIPPSSLSMAAAEERVVHLPQVAAYFRAPYLFLTAHRSDGAPVAINVIGDADTALYRTVDRPLVVAGRLPDPRRPFEVAVNELAASDGHLGVGMTLRLHAASYAQVTSGALTNSSSGAIKPAGPSFRVHITGIVLSPQDVNAALPQIDSQGVTYEIQRNLYTTPAFLQALAQGEGIAVQQTPDINLVGVRLHHGTADWRAFAHSVARASGGAVTFTAPGNVYGINLTAASAQRGIHLDVVALIAFGLLIGLITLLFVGQALGRLAASQADDYAVLRSLGATRGQVVAVVLLIASLVGLVGSGLAVAAAYAASPLMPVGLARQAEIHPGFDANLAFFVIGFAALTLLLTAIALVPALRVSHHALADRSSGRTRIGAVSGFLARIASPITSIGVRFGLGAPRGNGTSTVGGLIIAAVSVATVAGSLTFAASLNALTGSPHAQGWNWDVLVGNPNDQGDHEQRSAALLAQNRDVSGYSAIGIIAGASQGTAIIDGHVVPFLIALDSFKGSVHPTLVAGHAPRAANQIVLAANTMAVLHKHIGQRVHIPTPTGALTLHIVGQMISPSVGDLFTNGLGEGGWVYGPGLHGQASTQSTSGLPPLVFDLFLVRYAPGVTPSAALASLQRQFGHDVLRHVPPEDVINLQSVSGLPWLLAGLVVIIGLVTVGNTLIVTVRRRRRDLAVFKTLGFVRRQVAGVVAWQATAIGLVALVVGLPVGVAVGRWAWTMVASGLGTSSPTVVPLGALALLIPCVLVVVNLLAGWPAWSAARIAPAQAMRTE
jgi:FtsX-like permease family